MTEGDQDGLRIKNFKKRLAIFSRYIIRDVAPSSLSHPKIPKSKFKTNLKFHLQDTLI